MIACDLIREAGRLGIDLCVQGGRLVIESPAGRPPPALHAAIRANRDAIRQALIAWPGIATFQRVYLARCRPLTPDALTPAERIEAEHLARELTASGGLGQHVVCLLGRWNDLSERERLAGLLAWQLATISVQLEQAA